MLKWGQPYPVDIRLGLAIPVRSAMWCTLGAVDLETKVNHVGNQSISQSRLHNGVPRKTLAPKLGWAFLIFLGWQYSVLVATCWCQESNVSWLHKHREGIIEVLFLKLSFPSPPVPHYVLLPLAFWPVSFPCNKHSHVYDSLHWFCEF